MAGSTFLDLVNRVLRRLNEVEVNSSEFTDLRGVQAAAKDAVVDTVREICTQKFEWPFHATEKTETLVIGQTFYNFPATMRNADWDSFVISKSVPLSNTTTELKPISKENWYHNYRKDDLDADATLGRDIPCYVWDNNDGTYGVSYLPNKAYTLKYRYYVHTTDLNLYTDTCIIPTEYDYVIMYGALTHMYMFFDNDERVAKIEQNYKRTLDDMTYVLIPKSPKFYDTRVNF